MAHVLIVDDDTSVREALYDGLSRRGYAVLTAASGAQALEVLKAHRPEVILLGLTLPGFLEFQAAEKIRSVDDAVPIVLLRGGEDPDVPEADLRRLKIAAVVRKEAGVESLLKYVEPSRRHVKEPPGAPQEAAAGRANGPLLVVDDDPGILRLLRSFFESRGMSVMTAGSGEEALAALARRPVAVLLDLAMPGMDGLMTLKKMRACQPTLPVVMVSGFGDERAVQEAMEGGARGYVTKPFDLDSLERVVLAKVLSASSA